jgi:hypothetical protein
MTDLDLYHYWMFWYYDDFARWMSSGRTTHLCFDSSEI